MFTWHFTEFNYNRENYIVTVASYYLGKRKIPLFYELITSFILPCGKFN